jgi:hypothetical protein
MGAAWRGPKARDLEPVLEMVREVKALGLEACCTLGMLKDGQAEQLKRERASTTTTTTSTPRRSTTARDLDRATTRIASRRSSACAAPASRSAAAASSAWVNRALRARPHRAAREPGPPSRVGSHQRAGPGRGHAAGGEREASLDRVRPHHRHGAHPAAQERGAAFRGTHRDERGGAGALLLRRRQLDLLRREAAHHRQSRGGRATMRCSPRSACSPPRTRRAARVR